MHSSCERNRLQMDLFSFPLYFPFLTCQRDLVFELRQLHCSPTLKMVAITAEATQLETMQLILTVAQLQQQQQQLWARKQQLLLLCCCFPGTTSFWVCWLSIQQLQVCIKYICIFIWKFVALTHANFTSLLLLLAFYVRPLGHLAYLECKGVGQQGVLKAFSYNCSFRLDLRLFAYAFLRYNRA